jgi:multidrug efflux pump subunit AcrA (membrane-fusion protein)
VEAPSVVVVDSTRKVVQHVEGGAIADLLVREGDRVEAGQVLLRLDDLEARALLEVLDGRFLSLSAQAARLRAEREEHDIVVLPEVTNARRGEPRIAETFTA